MKALFPFALLLVLSLTIHGQKANTAPLALGESHTFPSKVLHEERTLNVYLPEGYSPDSTYPVIYLLDGSWDEDFLHVAGLLQFSNFPWLGWVRPSILVGIANTDRKRDFTYPTTIEEDKVKFPTTGGSGAFITFMETEVKPFINSTYKTTGETTLIGQSLGGLLVSQIVLRQPDMYTHYVIVSPSLWWDGGSLLRDAQTALPVGCRVHVAVGKEGAGMVKPAKELVKVMQKGAPNPGLVTFDYLPEEDHATILHEALYRAWRRGGW
jgi:uncharacterized protein